ncbi:hypothetical protein CAPTEDRAFT_198804 [Capitella teleta]|uniref:Endonuclease/exonuclease/phosphatase domain-containing protein n=1 Tax=Capitella teleta TaxID=283909 RepID=R7TRK4_CAPTE|nr:hypothetical protein CAPTEDRAFT_198804 [Capitella teleta]|eukprot:ELT93660.1 hypothetical protein CAPTEDRAFT_198804 [Capitella teleta]
MGSVDKVHLNSVLTYAVKDLQSARPVDVKHACISFYTQDDLLQAKTLLWKAAGETLIDRSISPRKIEMEKIADNIMTALSKLMNAKALLPMFAVGPDLLHMIPKAQAQDTLSISVCETLNSMEEELIMMKSLYARVDEMERRIKIIYSIVAAKPPACAKAESIESYFKVHKVIQKTVERMSKTTAPQASFRVEVVQTDFAKVYDATFWPGGMLVDKFYNRPKLQNHLLRHQHDDGRRVNSDDGSSDGRHAVNILAQAQSPVEQDDEHQEISEETPLKTTTLWDQGPADDQIAYMHRLMKGCDILFIQEHWLYQDDLDGLCLNPDFLVFGTSAVDPSEIRMGRPYGGCAMISKKNMNCIHMLALNIYMPCDTTYDMYNVGMYNDVLYEIESLIDINHDIDIVVVVTLTLTQRDLILCMCTYSHIAQVDFTYTNEATGSKSVLDHFIVSCNVFDGIKRYNVLHDGDNLSDHHPVQLELYVDVEYSSECEMQSKPRQSWHRANQANLDSYRRHLRTELSRVQLPVKALVSTLFNCTNHLDGLKEYYASIEKAVVSSARLSIPKRKKKALAGWLEHLGPYKKDAIFWHSVWGSLATVVRQTWTATLDEEIEHTVDAILELIAIR